MNAIVLNNISTYMCPDAIAQLLHESGILTAFNLVDFYNNSYSKTVMVQVEQWHDTEEAYQIIKDLKYRGETRIETDEMVLEVSKAITHEVEIMAEEYRIKEQYYNQQIDAQLEQKYEDDQQEWLDRYENDSMYDDLSREESYLYLDLRDLIGVQ